MHERKAEFLVRDVSCPFVDKTSIDNPAAGSYEPKKKLINVSSSSALSNVNDSSFISSQSITKTKVKVHKGQSLSRLQTLDEVDEDTQFKGIDLTK